MGFLGDLGTAAVNSMVQKEKEIEKWVDYYDGYSTEKLVDMIKKKHVSQNQYLGIRRILRDRGVID